MTRGRTWLLPPSDAATLHAVGDCHYTATGIRSFSTRGNRILWDMLYGDVPEVSHHLFTGDMTDTGSAPEDAAFLAWANQFPGDNLYIVGNHDVNLNNNTRTPEQVATAYGMAGKNYTHDLPFGVRIIALGFDSMADGASTVRLSDATLAYLDAELTAAGSTPCWIACHSPLYGTLTGGTVAGQAETGATTSGFYVIGGTGAKTNSQEILDVLAGFPNVKAWISGHTHSSIEVPDIVSSITLGGNKIATINTSSPAYVGNVAEGWDRIATPYVTWLGDEIQVRWRDHGRKQFVAPLGAPEKIVMRVTGL